MTNETVSTKEFAVALMKATGSVASTYDDGRGTVATAVNVDGVSVVMVDPKAELAEVMGFVAVRKNFYNKAMASLRAVYEIEKREREALKGYKLALKTAKEAKVDAQIAIAEAFVRDAEASLVETMAMVMGRKKFFNRVAKSLQSIYVVENRLRAAIKIAKAK